jgi:hypothetical protein
LQYPVTSALSALHCEMLLPPCQNA